VCLKSLTASAGYFKSRSPHAKPAFGCEVTKECQARFGSFLTPHYNASTPAAKMPFASAGLPRLSAWENSFYRV